MQDAGQALVRGQVDLEALPDLPARLVRIYLSCTATDTVTERAALAERVYPVLRDQVKQQYGLEFQVVDLRWGMQSEWADDSSERQLYVQELQECQRLSVGPNFVALIGQRYGHRALPAVIGAEDFDLIRQALRHHRTRETRDVALLDHWYKSDTNAIPPVYVLQPQNSQPQHTQNNIMQICDVKKEPKSWEETRAALLRLIKKGSELCILDGSFPESDRLKYIMSDLEHEVQLGAIQTVDPSKMCHIFHRTIVDLKNYVSEPQAWRFMEVTRDEREGKMQPDTECELWLHQLTEEKLLKNYPQTNINRFSVLWRFDDGIHQTLHETYLNEFCAAFHAGIQRLLDTDIHVPESQGDSGLHHEIYQHWLWCKQRIQGFHGREDILETVRAYVSEDNLSQPLVLYGDSGCGKTSTMAKAASLIPAWFGEEVVTIVRFIGITGPSCEIGQLLHSLCCHLTEIMDSSSNDIPRGFKDLVICFEGLLAQVSQKHKVVIFLNALHVLAPQNDAHKLSWLPMELPANIKIIVSTLPETHGILQTLQMEMIQNESQFIEIAPMSVEESVALLTDSLSEQGRCMTDDQLEVVTQAFQSCGVALYAYLLLQEVLTWKSYDTPAVNSLPGSVKEMLHSWFDRLEGMHGKVLVSRSLAYLTASMTGLGDCEIEDILSLDDRVLAEVLDGQEPPVYRVPPSSWLRLKRTLQSLLIQKNCDGVTVYFWYHRQFIEVITDRYLNEEAVRKEIHSNMADYFLGIWNNKKKPFGRPKSGNNETNSQSLDVNRLVPAQPLTFSNSDVTQFNKRKFDQVPRHLFLSGRLDELGKSVMFSYEWLYNKMKALSPEQVMSDFSLNPGMEATLVGKAIKDAQSVLQSDMDNLGPELTGRLMAYYPTHSNIRQLIQQCDTLGLANCGLIPNFPYQQVPGSSLKYSLQCKGQPDTFTLKGDKSQYLMAKEASSPLVQMFDLNNGDHIGDIETSVGDMHVTPDGRHFVIVDHISKMVLKIHSAEDGNFLGQLIPMNHIQMKPKEKYSLGELSLSDEYICLVVTTDQSYLCIAELKTCRFLHIQGLEGRADLCKMTPDLRFVFVNSNQKLMSFDLKTLEPIYSRELEYRPQDLTFTFDGSRSFLTNDSERKVYMMHIRGGAVEFMYKVALEQYFIDDHIISMKVSPDQESLLVQGKTNLLVYDIETEKVNCHLPRPADVPKEFKLPKSPYIDIFYTQASFSPDSKFLAAAIFHSVYIWHIANGRLLTSVQTPVGIIQQLLIPEERGQLVTHQEHSSEISVWGLADAISQSRMSDKMTCSVEEIQVTKDGKFAFIRCTGSDEIGVLDIATGKLVDLLTHMTPVSSFSVTQDGKFCLLTCPKDKPGTVNKIWSIAERRVICEFGNVEAMTVSMLENNAIVAVYQEERVFKASYTVSLFKLEGGFEQYEFEEKLPFVLAKPFLTPEDKYLVILTADDYEDSIAHYVNPTICAISMQGSSMCMSTYSAQNLREHVIMRRILHVRPYEANSYTVLALFTNEMDLLDEGRRSRGYEHCYGFLILDVCSGVVCQVLDSFLAPGTPMDHVLFTDDVSMAIDDESNVFSMATGYYIKRLADSPVRPHCTVLGGKAVLYYEGSQLWAVRVLDAEVMGRVEVHGHVTALHVCRDQRTVVLGCEDGSLASYVLIDPKNDDVASCLAQIPSRQPVPSMGRSWDKVNIENGEPPQYSRPPSAMATGPQDKELLQKVKPASRGRPQSDGRRSQACVVQ